MLYYFLIIYTGSNKITSIAPEIFSNLLKLKELQLFKNKITIIPSEIGLLQRIERISFASNNIKVY
jgi:Leucine-rich repeat (LRR) protein